MLPQVSLRQSKSSDWRNARADLDFVGPEACTIFGAFFLEKEYKITDIKLGTKVNIY
jgi:hypothetical protein